MLTTNSTTRRVVATLTVIAAVAGVSAGPAAASASAAGNCPQWMCGSNHNEILATTDGS